MKRFLTLSSLLYLLIQGNLISQQLVCNNHINVSVNDQCALDLTVEAFLEGDVSSQPDVLNGEYVYTIYYGAQAIVTGDNTGPTMGGNDMTSYINLTLEFKVTYQTNQNFCWGTLLIEDKIPPAINCDCPEGGLGNGNYAPECSGMCYEIEPLQEHYWSSFINSIVPSDADDIIDDSVEDNCGNIDALDISYYDVYEDLGACEGVLLRRTWTVQGGNPFGTNCVKEYFFKRLSVNDAIDAPFNNSPSGAMPIPVEDRLLLPKRTIEIPICGVSNDPASIAAYFDNPLTEDQDTNDNNIDPDELDIDCVIENNEGIWYAYPHYYINGRNPSGPHAQPVSADKVCTLVAGYTDTVIDACAPGCFGNSKTLRTWTILDWCTQEIINHEQIIKIVDTEGPNILANDINVSVAPWECSVDVHMPRPEHIVDECDNIVTYYIGAVSGGYSVTGNAQSGFVINDVRVGTHTVEYIAQDCCNNLSKLSVIINVTDNTPPVAISKEFIVTSLTNFGNPGQGQDNGISKIFASNFDNGSYDGCSDVTLEVRRTYSPCDPQDTIWGDFVKFCCDDLIGVESIEIPVELRVLDSNGNENRVWSAVKLEDKSNPNIFCPQSMVVTCDMDLDDFSVTGWPEGVGACGPFVFGVSEQEVIEDTEPRDKPASVPPLYDVDGDGLSDQVDAYHPGCGFGAIRRRFRNQGNVICEQWFVVESPFEFDFESIEFPRDMAVDCNDYDHGEPTWESSVCNLIGVTVDSDTFVAEQGSCMTILNHWSIIDWCKHDPVNPTAGGRYNHTQIIKIIDNTDPILTIQDSLVIEVGPDCSAKGIQLSATGQDEGECNSKWMAWNVTIDLDSDWNADYEYGTDQPVFVNGDPNPFYIPKSGNGDLISIILPDNIEESNNWHRVVWRTTDGCNNSVSQTTYFQVIDNKAPTPYCLNLSTAFMDNGAVELWAIDFNVNAFDNCTANDDLLFTFTDVLPPPRNDSEYDSQNDLVWYDGTYWYYNADTGEYEDRDDYGGDVQRWEPGLRSSGRIFTAADTDADGFTEVPVYVWDEGLNIDFCRVRLRIVDNNGGGMIAGRVTTETGEMVPGILTSIDAAMPGYPRFAFTDPTGRFAFPDAPFNVDYLLTGTSEDDYLNGVSTLDMVLIQRHILGLHSLNTPYKMIAADVNDDNNITAIDLIQLRKLILGIYEELPENSSWKVVDASQVLNTVNPWAHKQDKHLASISDNMMSEDFIGVKIGDVNGTVKLYNDNEVEKRSSEKTSFIYEDKSLFEGEVFWMNIHSNRDDIYAFQLQLDLSHFEVLAVEGQAILASNYKLKNENLKLSCSQNNQTYKGEFLRLKLMSNSDGLLSDLIKVNNSTLQSEVYVGEQLSIQELILSPLEEEEMSFELYQNNPNPFSESTAIEFNLPTATNVTLSLFDLNGRLLLEKNEGFEKGQNRFNISSSDISVNGIVIYKIETEKHSATKRMIVIQ